MYNKNSINQIVIVGRCGSKPQFLGNNGKMAGFSVATEHSQKNAAGAWETKLTWHRVVVLGQKRAETAVDYLDKGYQVSVIGRMDYSTYDSKEHPGVKINSAQIVADEFVNLTSKKDGEQIKASQPANQDTTKTTNHTGAKDISGNEFDEDIPF